MPELSDIGRIAGSQHRPYCTPCVTLRDTLMSYYVQERGAKTATDNTLSNRMEVAVTAADSWYLMVVGYAIMLAWPVSTVGLVTFALRYVASHRNAVVARSLQHGDGTPQHFWIIVPALNEGVVVG